MGLPFFISFIAHIYIFYIGEKWKSPGCSQYLPLSLYIFLSICVLELLCLRSPPLLSQKRDLIVNFPAKCLMGFDFSGFDARLTQKVLTKRIVWIEAAFVFPGWFFRAAWNFIGEVFYPELSVIQESFYCTVQRGTRILAFLFYHQDIALQFFISNRTGRVLILVLFWLIMSYK